MWRPYNPNGKARVGDCAVRAVACALGLSWEQAYMELAVAGLTAGDMPSANHVWGDVLSAHGFRRYPVETDGVTVRDFCRDHPRGLYVLAISGHVVCVRDGDWYDSWDSGDEVPVYYWKEG